MKDYRQEFYAQYHTAINSAEPLSKVRYEQCVRQFRGRWIRWLPTNKDSYILDLACGCGEYLYFLQSMGYKNIFGVDICEGELEHGRKIGIPNLLCATAQEYLQDKKECFDVISALNFFEHLQKDEIIQLLKLVHQALKPGGKLLAVTPNGLSPFAGATRYWDFSHETSFTPASWRQLARIIGFGDVLFEEYGPMPHSFLGSLRVVLWQLVRLGIIATCYVEVGGPRDTSRVYTADMKIILRK